MIEARLPKELVDWSLEGTEPRMAAADDESPVAEIEAAEPLKIPVVWSFAGTEAVAAAEAEKDDCACARIEEAKFPRKLEIWSLAITEVAATSFAGTEAATAATDEDWPFAGMTEAEPPEELGV